MKIGIVCYPTFGGSGVVATELGLALAKKGYKIHFITYKRPARLPQFHENIFFHEVGDTKYPLFEYAPYDTSLTSTLVNVAMYEQLDLLHVHYAIPHATIAYLTKQILAHKNYHLPFVTTLHGTDITLVGRDKSFSPVVEFSINKSDGITAVSEFLKRETEQAFQITKPIEVIYNFIDLEKFKASDKDHFKKAIAPNDEKIISHVSNFRKVKRVKDAILAFKKIREVIPSKLLMIGDGPERTNAENLCRELGICSDIRFLGKQNAVEELLSVSDLFLLPSGNESFGLAALEAMACHVPVISSDIGGLPEVNIHGETGFLSSVGDIESMAKHAIHLLSNQQRHEKFKEQAYQRALQFELELILPQYEAHYDRVLKTSRQMPESIL